MSLQRYDLLMDAVTMLCLLPFGITERIWWKSPHRTIVMPPNGRSMLFTFLCLNISPRVLSSTSIYLFCHWSLMSQVDSSIRIRWMWNLECAVPSLCRSSTAITHDTTSDHLLFNRSFGAFVDYHHCWDNSFRTPIIVEQCYNSVKMVLTGGGLIAQLSRLQSRRVNRRIGHWRAGCRWRKSMSKCHL
ncbi:hypothetical protein VPH35_051251 [Triticum aestivum]